MADNNMKDLMHFFANESDKDGKVPIKEFNLFWKSLSDEEKNYYKTAALV